MVLWGSTNQWENPAPEGRPQSQYSVRASPNTCRKSRCSKHTGWRALSAPSMRLHAAHDQSESSSSHVAQQRTGRNSRSGTRAPLNDPPSNNMQCHRDPRVPIEDAADSPAPTILGPRVPLKDAADSHGEGAMHRPARPFRAGTTLGNTNTCRSGFY